MTTRYRLGFSEEGIVFGADTPWIKLKMRTRATRKNGTGKTSKDDSTARLVKKLAR